MSRTTFVPMVFVCLALGAAASGAAELEVGKKAPEFTLHGTEGKTYKLSEQIGERGVVLAWFPKAFTPGCTVELQNLQESAAELARFDVAYYMVSLDTPEKNAEFAASLGGEFPVISDRDKKAAEAYGVLAPTGNYTLRWTFYIDPDGVLRKIDKSVDPKTAGPDVVANLEALGFPRRQTTEKK